MSQTTNLFLNLDEIFRWLCYRFSIQLEHIHREIKGLKVKLPLSIALGKPKMVYFLLKYLKDYLFLTVADL